MRLECVTKPHFDVFVVAKSSGDCKYDCQYWNNRKECGISKRRRLVHHTLCRKEAHSEYQLLQNLDKKEVQRLNVFAGDVPHIHLNELYYACDFTFHYALNMV